MFYFFSRAILFPEASTSPFMLIHFSPLLLLFFVRPEITISIIFLIGAGYSLWLTNIIYSLRTQRKRSRFELFFLGLFTIIAVLVLFLGFSLPYIDNSYFYLFYSNSIGLAFFLIVATLLSFPDLLNELSEAVKLSYAASTLKEINVSNKLQLLNTLMNTDKIYQQEDLSLSSLAEATQLTVHQLSELINTEFNISFSRYIREQRIREAKRLLSAEPTSSILAISMETGFRSQSNFYAAFKELTGMSPGGYRKKHV